MLITSPRSDCPINRTLEILGDQWSLLILRDIVTHDRRSFRDILTANIEGISAPVLSRRLSDLTNAGILTKIEAPRGKQGRYSLTDLGIQSIPLLLALAQWGATYDPTTAAHMPKIARVHEDGSLNVALESLRKLHLGV